MKKIWSIDGNEFFVRENAKEFLAMTKTLCIISMNI